MNDHVAGDKPEAEGSSQGASACERGEFEAWICRAQRAYSIKKLDNGNYFDPYVQRQWDLWENDGLPDGGLGVARSGLDV